MGLERNISDMVITIYDRYKELPVELEGWGMPAKENQLEAPSAKGIAKPEFETPRFPRYWYRSIRAGYVTYFTSELSPPEVGGDSAMELGMDL